MLIIDNHIIEKNDLILNSIIEKFISFGFNKKIGSRSIVFYKEEYPLAYKIISNKDENYNKFFNFIIKNKNKNYIHIHDKISLIDGFDIFIIENLKELNDNFLKNKIDALDKLLFIIFSEKGASIRKDIDFFNLEINENMSFDEQEGIKAVKYFIENNVDFFTAVITLFKFSIENNIIWDLNSSNVMNRKNELVITDPFVDYM